MDKTSTSSPPPPAHSLKPEAGSVAPGPQGVPLVGSIPAFLRRGLFRLVLASRKAYGPTFFLRLGPQRITFLTQPADLKQVLVSSKEHYCKGSGYQDYRDSILGAGLVTSDGEAYVRQRTLMQPFFTPKAVTFYAPLMALAADHLVSTWQEAAQRGAVVEVMEPLMELALCIICQAAFSEDVTGQAQPLGRDFQVVLKYLSTMSTGMGAVRKLVPTPATFRYKRAAARLDGFLRCRIGERRSQSGSERPSDLLTQLIEARDATTGEGMTDQSVLNELMTVVFAGFETIALTLTWSLYLLAQHPEVQREVQQEVEQVLAGRLPTADDLARLSATRRVLEETLRLYPPVWIFPREARAVERVSGYVVPPGSLVMACPYLTHRDPALWANAEHFQPERFLPEQQAARPPYSYYPFGAGPRTCLGKPFALQEGIIILASLVQHYQFLPAPGFVPHPHAAGTLGLRQGMQLIIQARSARRQALDPQTGVLRKSAGAAASHHTQQEQRMVKKVELALFKALFWLLYGGRESKPLGPNG